MNSPATPFFAYCYQCKECYASGAEFYKASGQSSKSDHAEYPTMFNPMEQPFMDDSSLRTYKLITLYN